MSALEGSSGFIPVGLRPDISGEFEARGFRMNWPFLRPPGACAASKSGRFCPSGGPGRLAEHSPGLYPQPGTQGSAAHPARNSEFRRTRLTRRNARVPTSGGPFHLRLPDGSFPPVCEKNSAFRRGSSPQGLGVPPTESPKMSVRFRDGFPALQRRSSSRLRRGTARSRKPRWKASWKKTEENHRCAEIP